MPLYLVTKETIGAMSELKAAGYTFARIGRLFGISTATVQFNLSNKRKTSAEPNLDRAREILTEALNKLGK